MTKKSKPKKIRQKPLTLDGLAEYNQEVLFPALEKVFLTKTEFKEFKSEMIGFRGDMTEFKQDMTEFKDKTLTNFDAVLKKLDILLDEKKVREYQEEKEKKLWAIVIKSLHEHCILSPKDLEKISQLKIF